MIDSNNKMERRGFIRAAAATTVATALGATRASANVPEEKTIPLSDAIPSRVLGKTGVRLPILGYGGAGLPKAWLNPLSYEDRVKLVRYSYERGVRYYDTAGNYMESQPIIGEALKDVRDKVFYTSKVEVMKAQNTRKGFEKVLSEMQTDYLDAVLIHGTPGLEQITVKEAMKIHGELVKLRDEGLVRFIGFSAHSYFDKALALIESDGFDLCMLAYGYIPRGSNQIHSSRMIALRDACVAQARKRDMGLVAMKVIGAGVLGRWAPHMTPGHDADSLKKLPAAAIRFVRDDKRFHLLTIGMRLKADVDDNIRILSRGGAYSDEDRSLLANYCVKAYESDALKKLPIE